MQLEKINILNRLQIYDNLLVNDKIPQKRGFNGYWRNSVR